ncbi:MAG: D-alanine-D-alanine ligase [Candidatus Moranbacteria bacterium GW2011_GWF2_35_39]|nr:MAG: D-alanine-D-alanine ligase [Candidatus Moranbacteria bacterium GW2011_GWF2_35_39]
MNKKINLAIIFGGKSGEHEVSLVSGRSIFNALDKKKYNIHLIGIDKNGNWRLGKPKDFWINPNDTKKIKLNPKSILITVANYNGKTYLINLANGKKIASVDVFFPITHGTFGEDGCLQGFLEMLEVAYVGPGVLGSAVGMDKDVMKRLFREAGIEIGKFCAWEENDCSTKAIAGAIEKLRFPIFVKPANLGSSVGISKAYNKKELEKAIKFAFEFDTKIILEENLAGREIECSVLGNDKPIASIPGEIKLNSDFYSYTAKYIDENSAVPVPKADLDKKTIKKIQETAVKIFKTLGCYGMGRVDFFLTKNGKLYANEINTLPGFTSISMYPKMFESSGINYSKLLDLLIEFAQEKRAQKNKLRREFKA